MVLSQYPINPTTTSEVHDLSLRKRCRGSRKYRMDPDTPNGRTQSKKSFIKAHYHPFLFATMAFSAMAELGLTAFLVSAGNEHHTWPSARYHSLLILFVFNAVWTTMFSTAYMMWIVDGATHLLASIASSVIWLMITAVLWGTAAGIMHNTRTGGSCAGRAAISRCRQSLTVEALGWTEFGLSMLTLIATCIWIQSSQRTYRSSFHSV